MKNSKLLVTLFFLLISFYSINTFASTGIICVPNDANRVVITLSEMCATNLTPENINRLSVEFRDNEGELSLDSIVKSSSNIYGEYDLIFKHIPNSIFVGIVGVTLTIPRPYDCQVNYIFEFRVENTCTGGKIRFE
ncbi:MAG: hypothetical protein HQK51_10705 [Oligoflexia bacterium]|nr:hypothetical protein [Oligoflexia bacterium]